MNPLCLPLSLSSGLMNLCFLLSISLLKPSLPFLCMISLLAFSADFNIDSNFSSDFKIKHKVKYQQNSQKIKSMFINKINMIKTVPHIFHWLHLLGFCFPPLPVPHIYHTPFSSRSIPHPPLPEGHWSSSVSLFPLVVQFLPPSSKDLTLSHAVPTKKPHMLRLQHKKNKKSV